MTRRKPPTGSRWRILAHGRRGERLSLHSADYPEPRMRDGPGKPWRLVGKIPKAERVKFSTVFDELVIAGTREGESLLHVEQMDTNRWWMLVGGVLHVEVTKRRDGTCLVSFYEDRAGGVAGAIEGRKR